MDYSGAQADDMVLATLGAVCVAGGVELTDIARAAGLAAYPVAPPTHSVRTKNVGRQRRGEPPRSALTVTIVQRPSTGRTPGLAFVLGCPLKS